MSSLFSDSDTSSESASSEESSAVSAAITMETMRPPNVYPATTHVQRTSTEMRLIAQAKESMTDSLDTYRLKMTASQIAYFYSQGRNHIDQAIRKKTMQSIKSTNLDRTISMMSDSASVVGSTIGSDHPYGGRNPSSFNQSMQAPSVLSETSNFRLNYPVPAVPAPMMPTGPSSRIPNNSFFFRQDRQQDVAHNMPRERPRPPAEVVTLLHAIDEFDSAEEPSSHIRNKSSSRKKRNSNPQSSKNTSSEDRTGPIGSSEERKRQKPTHPSGDSESDESDSPSPPKIAKTNSKEKSISKAPSAKVVKLREWRLRVVGEDLVVAGYSPDRSRAISGPIIKYSHPVIVAEKGEFAVEGPPYIGATYPKYLASYCKKGFPRKWKALTKKWVADIQAKPKPTKPRPSASSTPKAENPKNSKQISSLNKPKKRLSKSMDKSRSKAPSENQQKVVKPRPKSEVRLQKKAKETKPPSESESEDSVSPSESEAELFVLEPPKPEKQTTKDAKVPLKTPQESSTKETTHAKKRAAKDAKESKVQNQKAASKDTSAVPNPQPSSSKQADDAERRAKNRLFDDGSSSEDTDDYRITDPFANLHGDERVSLGKLTPNALMKSVDTDALDLGRHTPPMQRIQHLFESGTKSLASTGSPSSLNTSRDNPVAKRMNKDLGGLKKPKKKQPTATSGVENRDPKMGEAYKFLKKPTNKNLTTPNIVKKVFRNQTSEDGSDDEEELDQSLDY